MLVILLLKYYIITFCTAPNILLGSSFGDSRYQPILIDLQCTGNESSIADCLNENIPGNCTSNASDVAAVQCHSHGACEEAGLTHCCREQCKTGSCYCDSACSIFGDCCNDTGRVCSGE